MYVTGRLCASKYVHVYVCVRYCLTHPLSFQERSTYIADEARGGWYKTVGMLQPVKGHTNHVFRQDEVFGPEGQILRRKNDRTMKSLAEREDGFTIYAQWVVPRVLDRKTKKKVLLFSFSCLFFLALHPFPSVELEPTKRVHWSH